MTIALGVLSLLLALLAVPFSVEVVLADGGFRARPRWGPFALASNRSDEEPRTGAPRPKRKRRAKKRGKKTTGRKVRALLLSPDFLASVTRLGRRLLRELRPRHLRLRMRLGLGDPADTGRAWGAFSPLFLALSRLEADEIWLEPDFLHRTFDLEARAVVRVVPGVLLALMLGYFFTRAPWRALVRYARA